MPSLPEEIREAITRAMARSGVPGVSLGIDAKGEHYLWAYGVTDVSDPRAVTPNTRFQIGSVTKTFTASLVLRLRDEGLVDLDSPVRTYVPRLRLGDPRAASQVTVQHLLTHTAGWEGDLTASLHPEDSIAGYVDHMDQLRQLTPPGETWAYNNAAFVLLGRLVELVTARPFERALSDLVIEPLGLSATRLVSRRPRGRKVAAIHVVTPSGPQAAQPWRLSTASGPAGGLVSTAGDLLRYARFHLNKPVVVAEHPVLAPATIAEMQAEHARAGSIADAVGLSWLIWNDPGARIIFHTGDTVGHQALVALVPTEELALVVLANSDGGAAVCAEVLDQVLARFLGVRRKKPVRHRVSDGQLREYRGHYHTPLWNFHVNPSDGDLSIEVTRNTYLHRLSPPPPETTQSWGIVTAVDEFTLVEGPWARMRGEFLRDRHGEVVWLRLAGRLATRIDAD